MLGDVAELRGGEGVPVTIGYAIDCSHYQSPTALPWSRYAGKVDAVIVRMANGTTLDQAATGHAAKVRELGGAKLGAYTFFRSEQSVSDQFLALRVAADTCHLGAGDVVPALDIEDDTPNGNLIVPSWSAKAEELAGRIAEEWGGCLIYVTQRDWGRLGKPAWALHFPLWCANYREGKPATPAGMPCVLWQHRVGFFDPSGPGGAFDEPKQPKSQPSAVPPVIDQSRILLPLPLIGSRISDEDREKVTQLVALSLAEEARGIDHDAPTDPAPPPPDEVA